MCSLHSLIEMSLRSAGNGDPQSPFTSPEDLMKNLPKAMSNMLSGSGGMSGDSPIFQNHNEGI